MSGKCSRQQAWRGRRTLEEIGEGILPGCGSSLEWSSRAKYRTLNHIERQFIGQLQQLRWFPQATEMTA